MRQFASYGPIDTDEHYFINYSYREKLIHKAFNQLVGNNPEKTGHYILKSHTYMV